jgi:CBS domain-containing protein
MNEFETSVARHMRAPVQNVRDTEQVAVAARVMDELGVSALPVVDATSRLIGVLERAQLVSAGRFRGREADGTPIWSLPSGTVANHMESRIQIIAPTRSLRDCARRMVDRELSRVFVVGDNEIVGVVGTREILLAVASSGLEAPLGELAGASVPVVSVTATVAEATERCAGAASALVVVLDGSTPVGVFSLGALGVTLESHPKDAAGLWMDRTVLELGADTPAHVAAQRALDAGARYLVVRGESGYRVATRLSFAGRIVGEQATIAAAPVVIGTWERAPAASSPAVGPTPPQGVLEGSVRPVPSSAPGPSLRPPERHTSSGAPAAGSSGFGRPDPAAPASKR